MDDKKHHSFLGELGRTPLGFLLVLGAVAALTVAVLVPMLSSGSSGHRPTTAFADVNPPACDTSVGTAAASIRIDSAPPFPQDGDTLH